MRNSSQGGYQDPKYSGTFGRQQNSIDLSMGGFNNKPILTPTTNIAGLVNARTENSAGHYSHSFTTSQRTEPAKVQGKIDSHMSRKNSDFSFASGQKVSANPLMMNSSAKSKNEAAANAVAAYSAVVA